MRSLIDWFHAPTSGPSQMTGPPVHVILNGHDVDTVPWFGSLESSESIRQITFWDFHPKETEYLAGVVEREEQPRESLPFPGLKSICVDFPELGMLRAMEKMLKDRQTLSHSLGKPDSLEEIVLSHIEDITLEPSMADPLLSLLETAEECGVRMVSESGGPALRDFNPVRDLLEQRRERSDEKGTVRLGKCRDIY